MSLVDLGTYDTPKIDGIFKIDLGLLNFLRGVLKLTWFKKKKYSLFSQVLSQRRIN